MKYWDILKNFDNGNEHSENISKHFSNCPPLTLGMQIVNICLPDTKIYWCLFVSIIMHVFVLQFASSKHF